MVSATAGPVSQPGSAPALASVPSEAPETVSTTDSPIVLPPAPPEPISPDATPPIASQPAVGVQASLRSIWAANDLGTKQALSMGPSLLTTGFDMAGMEEGNAAFSSGKRIEPRTR